MKSIGASIGIGLLSKEGFAGESRSRCSWVWETYAP